MSAKLRIRAGALVALTIALAVRLPMPAAAQTCEDLGWRFIRSASAAEVAACLRSGVAPDIPDDLGQTSLHRAALYATDPAVIATLVEFGADLNARDIDETTPLHHAWGNPKSAGRTRAPPARGRSNRP